MSYSLNFLSSCVLAVVLQEKYDAVIASCNVENEEFHCDFEVPTAISSKDFLRIIKEMNKVIANPSDLKCVIYSKEKTLELFKDNKYVLETIKDWDLEEYIVVSLKNKFFTISKLPIEKHLKISNIKAFDLDNVGGVYWKGDDKNKQLTRISGYAFEDKVQLDAYKAVLKDQKDRDHRKIGADLELFTFDLLAGQGLPFWLPKGTAIKHEIENFMHDMLVFHDYNFVQTPVLGSVDLYKTSEHWFHYRDSMFSPLEIDGQMLLLRPMTCPHHMLVYKNKPHSYRELPYRIAEHAILHRYEASGALTGFERVRSMQLVDTHILITPNQIKDEIKRSYDIIQKCHEALGTSIHQIDLSLHDPKDKKKFYDDEQMWSSAETQLKDALDSMGLKYRQMVGEAAFYGPKIDLQVKTALGRVITVSTIQLDFLLPKKFDLKYIDENGQLQTPILIHCGIIGTFERFLAILLEQTKGVLPTWLAPTQVAIIPVTEKNLDYAKEINTNLKLVNIRTKLYDPSERVGKNIRESQMQKIPFQIVLGDVETQDKKVSYRRYGSEEVKVVTVEEFIHLVKQQTYSKK